MFLSVAQTPKNQRDSSFALLQLKKLYLYHSGKTTFPHIARTPEGKPYFVSSSPDSPHPWQFNLSHSRGWVAVALDVHPIGVDIQVFRPVSEKLRARVCSPSEIAWLSSLPSQVQVQGFAFLWCGKEAICKESGVGIGSGKQLPTLSLEPPPQKDQLPFSLHHGSILSRHTASSSPLARRVTPHFALGVSGLGVTPF